MTYKIMKVSLKIYIVLHRLCFRGNEEASRSGCVNSKFAI